MWGNFIMDEVTILKKEGFHSIMGTTRFMVFRVARNIIYFTTRLVQKLTIVVAPCMFRMNFRMLKGLLQSSLVKKGELSYESIKMNPFIFSSHSMLSIIISLSSPRPI